MVRGLVPDEESAILEPFLAAPGEQGGRPPGDHRRVLDGIFWINRTVAPWRDLPAEFGNWNSVWRQFRRWAQSGVWDVMPEGFADSGGDTDLLQMIDSSVIRAHRCAAGIKGGLEIRRWAARGADFPANSTAARMPTACPSRRCRARA